MDIIGHQKIISFLNKSFQKGNLSHAYLFTGPEHVGKFTVAMNFAEKILDDVRETNPDLIIIKPEIEEKKGITKKKAISIETIREMQRKSAIAQSKGNHKIIIIDDADCLNISSQNALLKTLEEPPEKVILVLIAADPQKLLPTIISRCQIKRFNLVPDGELDSMIGSSGNKKEILFWSMNRPGLVDRYIKSPEELKKVGENKKDLEKIISGTVSERFALAEVWSKDVPALLERLSLMTVLIRRDLLSSKQAFDIPAQRCVVLIEKTIQTIGILKTTNANARLMLENLMLEF